MSLERFHRAQASRWAGYDTALAEIRAGEKRSHWIWYVFPQIDGLGHSSAAREYAIRDLAEACDYLRDPLLRTRYEEIARAAFEHLSRGVAIDDLMGSSIDALKLVSSLTLFRAASQRLANEDASYSSLASLCDSLLQQAATQGYPACTFTVNRLAA